MGIRGHMRQWFRDNGWTILVCTLSVLIGIIVGFLAVSDPLLHHWRISQNLIDRNIINSINPERGLFNFLFSRFFDIFFAAILMFLMVLTRFTKWMVFPFLGLQGYWVVVNLFWIMNRFGLSGVILAISYLVILILVLLIMISVAVFIIKLGRIIRKFGFRACDNTHLKVITIFTAIVVALAIIEWMLYFLILSRMVFPQG